MKFKSFWKKNSDTKKRKITPFGGFVLIFSGILFAFLLGEILVRCFFVLPLEKEYLRFFCNNYEKIPNKNQDRDLFWKPFEEFRQVKYSLKKDKDTFRIICIGDSITQGCAQEKGLLPVEETYPYKLQRILASNIKNAKIEVVNAGRGGYSSLQGLRYLKKSLWQYEPDLVISWFGVNDFFYALFYADKDQMTQSEVKSKQHNVFKKSKLFLLIKNFSFLKSALKNPKTRVPPEDFYDNCREMIFLSKEKGFEIAFVAPFQLGSSSMIEYFEGYPEKLDELNKKYGCRILYLKPFFSQKDMLELYSDSCHFNDKGNEVVAKILFELLQDEWKKYGIGPNHS